MPESTTSVQDRQEVMMDRPGALVRLLCIIDERRRRERLRVVSHVDVCAGDWNKIEERGVEVKYASFVPRDRLWIEVVS